MKSEAVVFRDVLYVSLCFDVLRQDAEHTSEDMSCALEFDIGFLGYVTICLVVRLSFSAALGLEEYIVSRNNNRVYRVKHHNSVRCAVPTMNLLIMQFSRTSILDATWRHRHLQNFGTQVMQKQKLCFDLLQDLGIRNRVTVFRYIGNVMITQA